MASYAELGYGSRHLAGYTAFVDADSIRPLGLEAEMRRLEYRQRANVHAETYSIGVRYHHAWGRFQPYGKVLGGLGNFNYPYNLATGRYAVLTLGGGTDVRWRKRIDFRGDMEYQRWPQFTFGAMSSYAVSAGVRIRVFGPTRP
jgi:hypothetical protein